MKLSVKSSPMTAVLVGFETQLNRTPESSHVFGPIAWGGAGSAGMFANAVSAAVSPHFDAKQHHGSPLRFDSQCAARSALEKSSGASLRPSPRFDDKMMYQYFRDFDPYLQGSRFDHRCVQIRVQLKDTPFPVGVLVYIARQSEKI